MICRVCPKIADNSNICAIIQKIPHSKNIFYRNCVFFRQIILNHCVKKNIRIAQNGGFYCAKNIFQLRFLYIFKTGIKIRNFEICFKAKQSSPNLQNTQKQALPSIKSYIILLQQLYSPLR
jgi:hypothetical protein